MTPVLSEDIQCHAWPCSFLYLKIIKSDIRLQGKWAVILVITYHDMTILIFPRCLCRYVWVNIHTLAPRTIIKNSMNATYYSSFVKFQQDCLQPHFSTFKGWVLEFNCPLYCPPIVPFDVAGYCVPNVSIIHQLKSPHISARTIDPDQDSWNGSKSFDSGIYKCLLSVIMKCKCICMRSLWQYCTLIVYVFCWSNKYCLNQMYIFIVQISLWVQWTVQFTPWY